MSPCESIYINSQSAVTTGHVETDLKCVVHYTSAGPVPVRICPLNGYWSRVHSFDMNVPFMN